MQFSALQHQVELLGKTVKNEVRDEHQMQGKVRGLQSEVRHLSREEHDLEKKEKNLDEKEQKLEHDQHKDDHHHHEEPESHHMHSFNPFHHIGGDGAPNPIQALFGGLGDFIRDMRHTGPAENHHMGPIVPMHNLFHPGAHPSQKRKEQEEADKK